MNEAFNAIPLLERELKILVWIGMVKVCLWIVTFIVVPWFLPGTISTACYLILFSDFDVVHDESQVLAAPEPSNVIEVVGPRQRHTADIPYTLTLRSASSTEPLIHPGSQQDISLHAWNRAKELMPQIHALATDRLVDHRALLRSPAIT